MLSPRIPTVFIRTLGMFQITRDGLRIPSTAWQPTKAPQLLKILIAQREPVARKQLIELLWPQTDPARAGNQLSVLLSMTYQLLHSPGGAGPLVTDGRTVWLDRTQVNVDVDEFLTQADFALHAHRTHQRDAVALLQAAAAAYTGDFLPDDAHHDWAIPLADEVSFTYLAVIQALSTIHRR